jgi:ribose transport system ATP-binding protein
VDGKEVVYKTPREAEKAGIVYISHRMEEIFELCDRITVLRDGEYVGTRNICDIYIEGKNVS